MDDRSEASCVHYIGSELLHQLTVSKVKVLVTIVIDRIFIDYSIDLILLKGNVMIESLLHFSLNRILVLKWTQS